MRILHSELPAKEIFNANDPALLWNVAKEYRESWWSTEYDTLRDLLREVFVAEFDKLTGHYTRLRESIDANGFLDPVIITAGKPLRREAWMIPPNTQYICESVGGSRLLIASEHNMTVPVIINDQVGVAGEVLNSQDAVSRHFRSGSYTVHYGPPCTVSVKRYPHMDKDYTLKEQQRCRRQVKALQIQAWKQWSAQNTSASGA